MENNELRQSKNRMLLLLRNSSKKQAEKKITEDGKIEYDIPLQRSILRPWAEKLGYEVVGELVEGGVSGYKISADKRDAVIELKAMADRGEFDVLGIYMSDRLGRIADETPLIVSFLNARGIKVLSYTDGEISSQTHSEKLMTYIRFWQAEGESIKTSIRIKDAHEKAVEQGKWRAGCPPYGYQTVSRGTLNGKGRPIRDIEIDPEAAEIVKKIFKLYKEHYSTKGIAKILNDTGIPTQKGGLWVAATIKGILKNKQYCGIYELGRTTGKIKVISPVMEYLRFISDEDFFEVQEIIKKNTKRKLGIRPTIRGSRILTGLLYCDCGQKYTSQTNIGRQKRKDNSVNEKEYTTYRCGSYRKPKEGQCNKKGFNADALDRIIIDDAKKFLEETDVNQLMFSHQDNIKEKEQEIVAQLMRLSKEKLQKEKELKKYKEEFDKIIMGESQTPKHIIIERIETKEQELIEISNKQQEVEFREKELAALLAAQKATCSELTNWTDRFEVLDTMGQKSMLINVIEKITIHDEEIEVEYKLPLDYLWNNDKMDVAMDDQKPVPAFFYPMSVQGDMRPRTPITT